MHFIKICLKIKRYLKIVILTASLISLNSLAKVTMTIDREDISQGETFVLDIQIDQNSDVQPDLSLIPKEFTIVSSSQYSNTQIFNGQRTSIKGWKIKLKTLEKGPITIPAIEVGGEFTQPIHLTIKDTSNQFNLNDQTKAIFLESDIDSDSVYVQQQVIYTISLFRAINIHYASLTEPTAANSIIEKLGDDEQFERLINNRRYLVTKRKYAIFPQQSGEIEINPVNFTAEVNDNSRRNYGGFINTTRPVSISTPAVKLQVKPKPSHIIGTWLPASKVTLTDQWTPNVSTLTVDEPVTWTLTLAVQGLSEAQLPEIKIPQVDGLQWYSDTAQKERKINSKGILGKRVEKLAVIPSKAGTFTIPEIKLTWWDTDSNATKETILPAKTLTVIAASGKSQAPAINPPQSIPAHPQTTTIIDTRAVKQWQLISAVLLTLWILTLIAFFKKRKVTQPHSPHLKTHTPANESASRVLSELKQTINTGSAQKVEQLLLKWIQLSGYSNINSLGKLAGKLSDSSLKKMLLEFEAARYSAIAEQQEHEIKLSQTNIEAILSDLNSQQSTTTTNPIPPLYAQNNQLH